MYKLGRKAVVTDSRTLKLEKYGLPNAPATADWSKGVKSWGAMDNNVLGCCFSEDTEVALLDGRTLTFKQLVEQFPNEPFYVYSYDFESGKLMPGLAHHPRLTRKDADVYKVTLDDGSSYKSTRDHTFMKLDGTFSQVEVGESCLSLYRWKDNHGYELARISSWNYGFYTHRMIASLTEKPDIPRYIEHENGEKEDRGGWVVHHVIDENGIPHKENNCPDKLAWMRWKDHQDYHKTHGTNWSAKWADPEWRAWKSNHNREIQKLSRHHPNVIAATKRNMWNYMHSTDPIIQAKIAETRRKNGERNAKLFLNTPKSQKKAIESRMKHYQEDAQFRERVSETARNNVKNAKRGQHVRWHVNRGLISDECIYCKEDKKLTSPNHKVVSIEYIGKENVYDLTVDNYHNFALGCGLIAHNCTIAGLGHATQIWSINTGKEFTVPDNEVLHYYEKWCGYVPGDPSTDQGGIEISVLNNFKHDGFDGVKLDAFASANVHNIGEIKSAINIFGGVYIGMLVPMYIMNNVPTLWDYNSSDSNDIDGGHCVFCYGYDENTIKFISWGSNYSMTLNYWNQWVDEAYALIGSDWLNSSGVDPQGFNLTQLQSDLALVR